MEQVDLYRYEVTGVLGAGADYEVLAALDRETGKQVVLKRPEPQMVYRQLHAGIEARTDRVVQMYQEIGHAIPTLVPLLGYTERTNHDAYFGDALGQAYRVLVADRALGMPLVGDIKARFRGVPIGVGQHLFALFPLVQINDQPPFAILQQLLDLEERCIDAGYLLLDLRPQNVFYQPLSGRISVIDCGALVDRKSSGDTPRRPQPDLHDFYLEMLKFYTTPLRPPLQAQAYREPYGLRPVVEFAGELDAMGRQFQRAPDAAVQAAAQTVISQVRHRSYTAVTDFRRDLLAYLDAVRAYHQSLRDLATAQQAWIDALAWLHDAYWQRYLFRPETDLARVAHSSHASG
jgi:serine/threonine protein kinase